MDRQFTVALKQRVPKHPSSPYHPDRVASILETLLDDMGFVPTGISPANKAVEDYMKDLIYTRGLEECGQLKHTIHLAASLIELGYHKCSLEEKKNLALFNWFAIYIDGRIGEDPVPFREFPSRLLRRQPQLDPVLPLFTEVLDRMWALYDPLAASAIFNDALAFMTGSCLEPELEKQPFIQGVDRFPWFMRDWTGASVAFSMFAFVKGKNYNILDVLQALPDMNFWTCVVNDLFSFHKEEVAGETGTYVYNRAQNDNKSRYETCEEIVEELGRARRTIHAILVKNPPALETWKTWERGYVEWRIIQTSRYHLNGLNIPLFKHYFSCFP